MRVVVIVILGALLGAAWQEGMGVLAGALLAWLAWRVVRLSRRLDALERRLDAAASGQSAPSAAAAQPLAAARASEAGPNSGAAQAAGGPAPADAGAAATLPPRAARERAEPALVPRPAAASIHARAGGAATPADGAATRADGAATPAGGAATPAGAQPPAMPPAMPAAARADASAAASATLDAAWRWLSGGNTIVKLGVAILFVGLAFLAKYASERVSVPIELRLAGIAGVAVVLLGLGWRLRQQRPGYAHALQGGAVAVLYLTLFAAFRFYGVLAVGPVFALMVLVAALAAALAVLQDARALAVIGALGGFATPLLVSTGSGDQVALLSYYLVLNLGIAAVAWFKTWRALNLIGFVFTFVVGTVWGVTRYSAADYASSQAFLIAFFVLFNAILLMPARHAAAASPPARADGWVNGSLLFGLPTITFVLQHGLVRDLEYGTALSALVLAAFYVAMAWVMRSRPQLAVTFEASLAIAVVFLTLVIPFALDARSTAGAWALEAAGLVWLGLRQARLAPRLFGYALFLAAGLAMALAQLFGRPPSSPANAHVFNALLAMGGSLAAACFLQRAGRAGASVAPGRLERLAEPALIGWASLWGLAAAAIEIAHFVPGPMARSAWLASLALMAMLYTALAARLDWNRVAWPVLALAPLMGLFALSAAAEGRSLTAHGGVWAWPLALAAYALALWRAAPHWPAKATPATHTLGALVLAVLGAVLGRTLTADWGEATSAWAWLGWLVVPALMLLWLPRPSLARRWPVRLAPAAYQAGAGALLTLGLLLWTLLANWYSNGAASPLPYLPLLNPLDLGVGAALTAAAIWLFSQAAQPLLAGRAWLVPAALGSTGFVWLNAMLIRAFHHFDGVPFRVEAWMRSLPVHTGITLLWTACALALMWVSARRTLRLPWMTGAALLAVVVLKLVIVDLSGSGTVTRIVSFIGVGLLMLVIGYIAPLPATKARHETP